MEISEFWDKFGRDCEYSFTGRMYNVVVCEHNKERRMMCCDAICPLPRWTQEQIDKTKKEAKEMYKKFVEKS